MFDISQTKSSEQTNTFTNLASLNLLGNRMKGEKIESDVPARLSPVFIVAVIETKLKGTRPIHVFNSIDA